MINATQPCMEQWAEGLIAKTPDGKAKYKCFEEFTGDDPATGEPLVIEDQEGELPPAPNRQYKTPHALIPELQKFITEMLEKKWIEPSASEFSSPVLILKKPNGKGYRLVVDLSFFSLSLRFCFSPLLICIHKCSINSFLSLS